MSIRRRVVVTGLGLSTPLGSGVDLVWKKLLLGQSGIQSLLDKPVFKDLPCQVAGLIPTGSTPGEYNPGNYVDKSDLKRIPVDSLHAIGTAAEALKDAHWMPTDRNTDNHLDTGVSIGNAGTSAISDLLDANTLIENGQYRKVSPYLIPNILPNTVAAYISMQFKLKGPNHCVSTACASGLHAIGDSAHMISRGMCNIMVAGSSDFSLNPVILAGFCRAKALSRKFNKEPQRASRPFDSKRDGFVPSEGAGIVILEELEHAKRRNADIIYGEIVGYGMAGDAFHITAPAEDGCGAIRAMKAALKDAAVDPEAVGHVNVHATSTILGDLIENRAVKKVFGSNANDLLIYAPKGALGHLLGAAGTVEAIITLLSVKNGLIPPNLNLEEKSDEFNLNYVIGKPAKWTRRNGLPRVAVTNSFGFGGTNASICISEYTE